MFCREGGILAAPIRTRPIQSVPLSLLSKTPLAYPARKDLKVDFVAVVIASHVHTVATTSPFNSRNILVACIVDSVNVCLSVIIATSFNSLIDENLNDLAFSFIKPLSSTGRIDTMFETSPLVVPKQLTPSVTSCSVFQFGIPA